MHIQASRIGDVRPSASVTPGPAPVPDRTCRFARVYDLTAERERRTPPAEVLDALADAALVCSRLDEAGLRVRFDIVANRVSASLRDAEGSFVRTLSLAETMDAASLLPPDAA